MSSYAVTQITDKRQVAEAEIVSGPDSVLATGGGIALAEGSTLSITGTTPLDSQKTFETMVSSKDSTLAGLLGLTDKLASGIFEQSTAAQQSIAGITTGGTTGQSNMLLLGLAVALLAFLTKR